MTTLQFTFEKTYKEIDVAGKLYKVNFDDDSIIKYQEGFLAYEKKAAEAKDMVTDFTKASIEEIKEVNAKQKEIMSEAIELFLGVDTFEELYEKSGRSLLNLFSLIDYLTNLVETELRNKAGNQLNEYLQNAKK
jgi:hypothetical protein